MIEDLKIFNILGKIQDYEVLNDEEITLFIEYINNITTQLYTIKNRIKNYDDNNKQLKNFIKELEEE